MPFQIVRNDITKVKADAIVNTANPEPTYGAGVDGAIYKAAGRAKLMAERKKIGKIAPGEVAVTPAFNLQAKYIIHTVGPVWTDGTHGEIENLERCYRNSLEKARELKCRSIAFPLIATGSYGFPKDKALEIALSEIQSFLLQHSMKVTLVVFDPKSFELSGSLIENVREYVDANYVESVSADEYGASRSSYSRSIERRRAQELLDMQENVIFLGEIETSPVRKPKPKKQTTVPPSISALVAGSDKTFQEKLFEIIDERGLTGPQVYNDYISKQVYSKIQSDKDYHPNKYTAIALCLSLHLDVEQTMDLIGRAGWTLSPSSKADLVVKGCILNHEFNIVKINIILFEFGCPELQKIK
ncbi:MAG: macro domain-containing protein [Lachnospiraceae bacterium]|nr:macro domain-containing protein [Lachnospiraceae bacterium]